MNEKNIKPRKLNQNEMLKEVKCDALESTPIDVKALKPIGLDELKVTKE